MWFLLLRFCSESLLKHCQMLARVFWLVVWVLLFSFQGIQIHGAVWALECSGLLLGCCFRAFGDGVAIWFPGDGVSRLFFELICALVVTRVMQGIIQSIMVGWLLGSRVVYQSNVNEKKQQPVESQMMTHYALILCSLHLVYEFYKLILSSSIIVMDFATVENMVSYIPNFIFFFASSGYLKCTFSC